MFLMERERGWLDNTTTICMGKRDSEGVVWYSLSWGAGTVGSGVPDLEGGLPVGARSFLEVEIQIVSLLEVVDADHLVVGAGAGGGGDQHRSEGEQGLC